MSTVRVVERLDVLNRRLAPRVHQADVALAADGDEAVAHGQAHHLLAVFQLHLRTHASQHNIRTLVGMLWLACYVL